MLRFLYCPVSHTHSHGRKSKHKDEEEDEEEEEEVEEDAATSHKTRKAPAKRTPKKKSRVL